MYDTSRREGGSSGLVGCGVIAITSVLLVATWAGSYNRLSRLHEGVDVAWREVDHAYRRRAGVVSTLMQSAAGTENIEGDAVAQLVAAHAAAERLHYESTPNSKELAQFEAAQSRLSSALSGPLAAMGPDPGLETTENGIAQARRRFNEATLAYNKTRRRFPTILLARVAGFGTSPYLDVAPGR